MDPRSRTCYRLAAEIVSLLVAVAETVFFSQHRCWLMMKVIARHCDSLAQRAAHVSADDAGALR